MLLLVCEKCCSSEGRLGYQAHMQKDFHPRTACPAAQARVEPTTHAETVQYFLETERDELEYEAARRRPLLTPDFFAHLTQAIGQSWCWCSLLVQFALKYLSVRLRVPCQ